MPRLDAAVCWTAAGLPAALRLASSLRLFGMRAVVDSEPRSLPGARTWHSQVAAVNLLHCTGEGKVAWVDTAGKTRRLPPEHVVGQMAGAVL